MVVSVPKGCCWLSTFSAKAPGMLDVLKRAGQSHTALIPPQMPAVALLQVEGRRVGHPGVGGLKVDRLGITHRRLMRMSSVEHFTEGCPLQ